MYKYSYNYFIKERLESAQFKTIDHIIARASRDVESGYCSPFTITGDRGEILLIQKEITERIDEYNKAQQNQEDPIPWPAPPVKITNNDSDSLRRIAEQLLGLADGIEEGYVGVKRGGMSLKTYLYIGEEEPDTMSLDSDIVFQVIGKEGEPSK